MQAFGKEKNTLLSFSYDPPAPGNLFNGTNNCVFQINLCCRLRVGTKHVQMLLCRGTRTYLRQPIGREYLSHIFANSYFD